MQISMYSFQTIDVAEYMRRMLLEVYRKMETGYKHKKTKQIVLNLEIDKEENKKVDKFIYLESGLESDRKNYCEI